MLRALAGLQALMLLVACEGGGAGGDGGGVDGGGGGECGAALGLWDSAHPVPSSSYQVLLAPALISGAVDPAADGDRATIGEGTLPYEIVIELAEPVPVVGVRHYPTGEGTASGASVSHLRVHLGDAGGCDAEAGDAVVPLGPFYEDFEVTPRVAQRVRLELLEVHGGGEDFAVEDIQILVGAAFETEPTTALYTEEPWSWDAAARIPGVGPIRWSLMEWPSGMEVDRDGLITWTPHISQGGEHVVHVFAARGEARIDLRFVLGVTVP